MKLGIGSYTYGWGCGIGGYPAPRTPLTWQTLLQRAQDMGVGVVQIANNMPLHEIDLDALMEHAQSKGIALEAGTRGIAPDHLRRYAAIAHNIGSPILRCVMDTKEHQPDFDEVVQTLTSVLPEFEKHNVTLAIENHDRFSAATLARLMDTLRGAPIGICLDVANSLGREEPMRHVVETLAPYTVNLHVKEYVIQRLPSYQGFVVHGAPFGHGMCDLNWLLPYLKEHSTGNYNAILEQWAPDQGDVEATIALEARWARESVAYLQAKFFSG
jgi:sugar phosphate isomerase/epimerase